MGVFDDLSRRDFNRLLAAALGGAVAGSAFAGRSFAGEEGEDTSPYLQEPHVCCGLNTCEGKGAGGENQCAGTGSCATAEHHGCHGKNACKGQGGCEESAGSNSCKGEGNCGVPLKKSSWKTVRSNFEAAMKEAGRKFGPAPEDCSS